LQKVSLGPLERYGEMISGVFICLVGATRKQHQRVVMVALPSGRRTSLLC
jgi:hypothetical protein